MIEENVTETKVKNDKVKKGLWVLLILSLLGNFYQGFNYSETLKQRDEQLDELGKQFSDINALYRESMEMVELYKQDNQAVGEELQAKVELLKQLKNEVEELKRTVSDKLTLIQKLKSKYDKIVKLNVELENKIDELLVENKTLYDKNDSLKVDLSNLESQKNELGKKLNKGSHLNAEYFTVSTYKKRSSGKYKETKLAKRATKIEVEFSLLANPIAEKGEKTVFLRIVSPSGVELGNPVMGSDVFVPDGKQEKIKYSAKKVYTYTGEKQQLSIAYVEDNRAIKFEKGLYEIEVYVDSHLSGNATFYLK